MLVSPASIRGVPNLLTWLQTAVFNGAIFMPNTQLMQELTRDAFDAYFEQDEACRPILVRLAKGKLRQSHPSHRRRSLTQPHLDTMIPEPLRLLQQDSQFAFQLFPTRKLAGKNPPHIVSQLLGIWALTTQSRAE